MPHLARLGLRVPWQVGIIKMPPKRSSRGGLGGDRVRAVQHLLVQLQPIARPEQLAVDYASSFVDDTQMVATSDIVQCSCEQPLPAVRARGRLLAPWRVWMRRLRQRWRRFDAAKAIDGRTRAHGPSHTPCSILGPRDPTSPPGD